jgi:hypothetical protein
MVMSPDQRAVRDHLSGGRFRSGVADGRWRLVHEVAPADGADNLVGWPFVVVAIRAAPRQNAPAEFAIRFELNSYPNTAPTGGIWDVDADVSLPADRRPKGDDLAQLFRADGWTGGAKAMYAPWDRLGLQAHPDWAQKYPQCAWNPGRELTFILENVHGMLNNDDYLGI